MHVGLYLASRHEVLNLRHVTMHRFRRLGLEQAGLGGLQGVTLGCSAFSSVSTRGCSSFLEERIRGSNTWVLLDILRSNNSVGEGEFQLSQST